MKLWVRLIVLVLGGLVAAALIGAGVLAFLVSRLDVRAEIERGVTEATGRQLTISGDVGVSYYPVLGLRAENASLANVEGGRAEAFAAIDNLSVGVEIAPLFRRQVDVRAIVLERPRIALEVDAEGQPNWILKPATTGEPAPPPQTGELPRFQLREMRIVDGELTFFDARRNAGWAVSDVDLTSAIRSLDDPIRVAGNVTYNEQQLRLDVTVGAPNAAMAGGVTPVELEINSDILTASFDGRTTAASGELQGAVRASGPSLRQLAAWGGAPITGGVGLERFAVSGELGIGGGQFAFSNAGFSLDLIRGRGDFILSELRNKPYVSGRLELFDLDVNPYLTGVAPPDAPADVEVGAASPESSPPRPLAEIATVEAAPRALDVETAPSETPLDLSGLHAINADLEITTAGMLFQHYQIDRSQMNVVINDGYMASTLHRLEFYGGTGSGRLEVDAREPVIRIVQELAAQGVDAQSFLTAAANFQNIEGRAELTYRLSTQGRSQSELISAADGLAHIEVVSGALRGVDIGGVSRTIRNVLNNELISPTARTPFQGFSATFSIADGVLASDDLSFNTPELRISGLGVFDLPQRRLDVRLAPRSLASGITIPFAMRGPWDRLGYDSDIRDRALREIQTRVRAVKAAELASR